MLGSEENGDKSALWFAGFMAALFFGLTQTVIALGVVWRGRDFGPLGPSETVSLFSGTVAAAGLSAIWYQVRQGAAAQSDARRQAIAREEAAQGEAREREELKALNGALRLDRLHLEFNEPSMQKSRDLGWRFITHLEENPDQYTAFARSWVLSDGQPSIPPASETLSSPAYGLDDYAHYNWAMTAVISFYVRLEMHLSVLRLHRHPDQLSKAIGAVDQRRIGELQRHPDQLREATGPFFWGYWACALLRFADACDAIYLAEHERAPEKPYFTQPLRRLDKLLSDIRNSD